MNSLRTLLYLIVTMALIMLVGEAYESDFPTWLRWGVYAYLLLTWVTCVRIIRRLT